MILTKRKKNIIKFVENEIGYRFNKKKGNNLKFNSCFDSTCDDSGIVINLKQKKIIHSVESSRSHYDSLTKYKDATKIDDDWMVSSKMLVNKLVTSCFLNTRSRIFRQKNDWIFYESSADRSKYIEYHNNDKKELVDLDIDETDLHTDMKKAKKQSKSAKNRDVWEELLGYDQYRGVKDKWKNWYSGTIVEVTFGKISLSIYYLKEKIHRSAKITKWGRKRELIDSLNYDFHSNLLCALDREKSSNKTLYFNSIFKDECFIVVDFNKRNVTFHAKENMYYKNITKIESNVGKVADKNKYEKTVWEKINEMFEKYDDEKWTFSISKDFVVK